MHGLFTGLVIKIACQKIAILKYLIIECVAKEIVRKHDPVDDDRCGLGLMVLVAVCSLY